MVATVITGVAAPGQVAANARAAAWTLTQEEAAAVAALTEDVPPA